MTPATVTVENNRLRDVITTERNCNIIIRQNGKPVFDLLFKDGVLQVIGEGGIVILPDAGNSVLIKLQ